MVDATGDIYDQLEDPAQQWVNLCVAYRERSINGVGEILRTAKASQWTQALWEAELAPTEDDLGWGSDPDDAVFDE